MSENLNYEKFHQKYKITISYVQKIKLQVVLVRAYDTKIRIEYKEIFFSHTTFCTMHSDMPFFWKNGHLNHCYKKIAMISGFFMNHPKGTSKIQQKNNIWFNKRIFWAHSSPITPPLAAQHKKRHLTRIRRLLPTGFNLQHLSKTLSINLERVIYFPMVQRDFHISPLFVPDWQAID